MKDNYYVQIIEHETGELVKEMGPMPKGMAKRVDRGVNINLNHEDYYTSIVQRRDYASGK